MAAPELARRSDDKVIAGVCGALARRFGLSPTLVRVVFVVSIILPGPQILLYLILWVVIPPKR